MESAVATASGDLFEWRRKNPLIEGLPEPGSLQEMWKALSFDPRSQWISPPHSLSERLQEAMRIAAVSVPSGELCHCAQRLLLAIHRELEKRDPRLPANRAQIHSRAARGGRAKLLKDIPWEPKGAPGFVIEGPTGESKSQFAERFCELIPQVFHREAGEEFGWLSLTQVVYLRVPMPTALSRAGFILEVAKALDAAADTNYSKELDKRSLSIDRQLVMLLVWMSLHRVALLIVEEAQEESLGSLAHEYLLFFLKVMNWGIVVLMIGNPRALKILKTFSQGNRRLTDGGWYTLLPVTDQRSKEWTCDLVPAIWGYNVLPEQDEPIDDLANFLFAATGGQRYVLARLRRESLIGAINDGASRVRKSDVLLAIRSPAMKPLRKLIDALVMQDKSYLQTLTDYPVDLLVEKWKLDKQRKAAGPTAP